MNTIDVSDMRGKHLNRPHKLANNVYDFALKHLHEIPHKNRIIRTLVVSISKIQT